MLNIFRRKQKRDQKLAQEIFDYFKIEKINNDTVVLGDFANRDFAHWLQFIHNGIQKAMNTKKLKDADVENYVNIMFYIGGQRVDIALVKDGRLGPHELLQQMKKTTE